MKIDPKLVERWWDEAMANTPSGVGAMSFFAQRAADHALEEAAKVCEDRDSGQGLPIDDEAFVCAAEIRAMKGTK